MHGFRKILCPVDFSDYSIWALRYASALAKDGNAQLFVCHLIPDLTQAISYLEGNYLGTVNEALATRATARTDEFIKSICPPDQPIIKKIGNGNPSEEILKLARESEADLIVMGTHGHTGYERFFLGSVTNRVLHKSTVPVLTICKPSHHFIQDDPAEPVKIRRILCALDFDSNNKRIVELALGIAREYKSTIHFLHAITKEAEDRDTLERNAHRSFRSLVNPEMEKESDIRFLIMPGEPGNMILKALELENIDLLVMGHHSRKPIEELFLGSVAKRIVTDAYCPVLIARSKADGMLAEASSF
jgi:nucleotide-binding universal stress UspA family protein